MSEQDQIRAIAELDGFQARFSIDENDSTVHLFKYDEKGGCLPDKVTDYLHSYDAIILVIQKQSLPIRIKTALYFLNTAKEELQNILSVINATPSQLCEALLRATGKWKP